MSAVTKACARMVSLPSSGEDYRTSLADCRVAIAAARGTDLDDVHPAQGWDLSERGYRVARDSWAPLASRASEYNRADYEKAREIWRTYRPDLVGDWPEWGGAK